MNPPYYGVGLLDDLHAYFPALLYEPSAFHSVQDVLSYVASQASLHFDRFSNARNRYQASVRPSGYSNNAAPVYTAPASTAPAPAPAAVASTPPRPLSTPRREPVIRALNFGTLPARITTHYQDLLGLPPTVMNMNLGLGDSLGALLEAATMDLAAFPAVRAPNTNFMEPVIVRPTSQQIEAASMVEEVADAPETPCAVCQDEIRTGETARTLNACDHMFHQNCIDTWFQGNVRCPVCRHDIREPVDSSSEEDRTPDSP